MPDLKLLPLSCANLTLLKALMEEEDRSYVSELGWDFTPIRKILASFLAQNLLPGYVAESSTRALAYTYFLIHHDKAIIGTLYASEHDFSQTAVNELLALAAKCLKDSEDIHRIEAQIIPFNDLNLTAGFTRLGFQYYPRYFVELDLATYRPRKPEPAESTIVSWDSAYVPLAAEVAFKSYQNEIDALICEDYCSRAGCQSYLNSLLENPGCGTFLPEASFMGIDRHGLPCGFIIGSRLSSLAGMIPQIAILPSHQGRGLGNALMDSALSQFRSLGFWTVSLTVTKKNRRAFEWYQRLGFNIRKEFGAYIWRRDALI